jgi:hypothetical protein
MDPRASGFRAVVGGHGGVSANSLRIIFRLAVNNLNHNLSGCDRADRVVAWPCAGMGAESPVVSPPAGTVRVGKVIANMCHFADDDHESRHVIRSCRLRCGQR